jgi:outer membrane protein OmpA-like peptidoglycan-associated protein
MKYLVVAVFAFMSTGCAMWPKEGQGGWGENFLRHEAGNESIWYTESHANLRRDLDHLSLRLEIMRARGIANCMPARLKLATLMAARITRQLNANMYAQTEHDLGIFHHQVNLLQVHFDDVQRSTGCGWDNLPLVMSTNVKNAAQELLNSDNQFAFTDDNITPKFLTRIQQASELIAPFKTISILLMGHTDHIGQPNFNFDLGLARANKVKQALIANGLEHAQIAVVSNGDKTPYAEGQSLATRLSNRRVQTIIIDLSNGSDTHSEHQQKPLVEWTHSLLDSKE